MSALLDPRIARSLLGEDIFQLPTGQVNASFLSAARYMLAHFDLVMVLELEQSSLKNLVQFGAGWRHALDEVHDKDSKGRNADSDLLSMIPFTTIQELYKSNAADERLYKFGQLLCMLDSIVYELVAGQSGEAWHAFQSRLGQNVSDACGFVGANHR